MRQSKDGTKGKRQRGEALRRPNMKKIQVEKQAKTTTREKE